MYETASDEMKKDPVSGYFSQDDIRNQKYTLLTDSPLGLYRVSGFSAAAVSALDTSRDYRSYMENYDFLVDSQETLDRYEAIRDQLLTKLFGQSKSF